MNVHFSYKISKTADLEKQVQHQLEKLSKYLQVFRPELVHCQRHREENSAREGFVVSLNLRLPSGQMATQEKSHRGRGRDQGGIRRVVEQLKKHKDLLRNEHRWQRRRGPQRAEIETVPFESTVAVVRPAAVSSTDIASYIDVSLPRLEGFVERQIAYRESFQGRLHPDQVATEDVVAGGQVTALSDELEKPERIKSNRGFTVWRVRPSTASLPQMVA